MCTLRIGKASLPVEGIRELKADVKLDDTLKSQLMKDGLDEVVFQKGDKLFIAYKTNLDLSRINLNLENFDENSAYDKGQLSIDGDAVKVLFTDDETKESFWAAPYKEAGRGIQSLVNTPLGKSGIIAFASGVTTGVVGKAIPGMVTDNEIGDGWLSKGMKGVVIGTLAGTTAAGLKAGQEMADQKDFWETGAALGVNALSFGGGILAGMGGYELVKASINNGKTAGLALGITAAVVTTGIILDLASDNGKTTTYKVINKIAK